MSDEASTANEASPSAAVTNDATVTVANGHEPKAKATRSKKEKAEEEFVIYRSRNEETTLFSLMDVRPIRNPEHPGHFEWRVPASLTERLDRHHHVTTGRVLRIG